MGLSRVRELIHEVPEYTAVGDTLRCRPKSIVIQDVVFSPNDAIRYLEDMLDFSRFDFSGVTLRNVKFESCNMTGVRFVGASFENVEFVNCAFELNETQEDLASFYDARIRAFYTGLSHLYKYNVVICNVESEDMHFLAETDGESIIGYKKIYVRNNYDDSMYDTAIAKLCIPFYADRIIYKGEKCRASCAQVLSIRDYGGNYYECGISAYYKYWEDFVYRVGHMAYADGFDDGPMQECGHGIHFFLTEQEAWAY